MNAKIANFLVYLAAAWILTGQALNSFILASVVSALAFAEYAWATIQWIGVVLMIAAFLRIVGLLPVWPGLAG